MSDVIVHGARFAMVPRWIIRDAGLSDKAIRLFLVLMDHANSDGECFPTRGTIARYMGCTTRTVSTARAELEAAGILQVRERRRDDGGQAANEYHLFIDPPLQSVAGASVKLASRQEVESLEVESIKSPPGDGAAVAVIEPQPPAQAVIAFYVDACRELGAEPPRRLIGQVARHVGELLSEGQPPEIVAKALELMIEKRLHPSTLATLIVEAAAGPAKPKSSQMRYGRGMTTDAILRRYGV